MKRKLLLIGIVIVFLLSACAPVAPADTTGELQVTTQATTDPAAETTAQPATEPPATEPPPEETTIPAYERRYIYGSFLYDDTRYFVYRGYDPFRSMKPDVSGCVVGALYEWNETTDELTLIAEGPVLDSMYIRTRSHYYYVLESDPATIMQSDRKGETHTVFYTSELGDVGYIRYTGYTDDGNLLFLLGGSRIMRCNMPEKTVEMIYKGENIDRFIYYDHDPLDGLSARIMFWKTDESSWLYHLDTGKLVQFDYL